MARFDLTDPEWAIISPLLPNKPRGVPRVDDRRVLNGIFWTLRTGSPWRDLPERYGPVHDGLQSLQPLGQGRRLAAHFRDAGRALAGFAAPDRLLDRPRASARRRRKKGGADHAIGRSRGGLSTKIHAVVDRDGLPVGCCLTPGQASDKTTLPTLIAGLRPARDAVADRGYSARAIIELFATRGTTAHIPSQSNVRVIRTVDLELYRQRNLVERFFNKLKHLRRIATRYDKLARNFLAAIALASVRLRIRHYESTT